MDALECAISKQCHVHDGACAENCDRLNAAECGSLAYCRVHGSVCSLPFLPTRPAGGDASSWRLMSKVPQRSRTSSQLAHAQSLGRFRSSLGRAADRGKLDGGAPSSKRFAKR